ncbi:MAG: SIMPL domain-containing protein [Gammaproteobacteria bacterium]|nr:SIMPL domain-containing protein [Gammaproteobacteria bacterium]
MKHLFLPAVCLFIVLPAAAEEDSRSVSVTGTASVIATPDKALINMGVEARNMDLQAARDRVARVAANFLKLADKLGIPEGKVQTTGLTMRPEYRWDRDGQQQQLQGYYVQRQLQVELDDIELLGELIEAAVNSGVNQVSPPLLDSSRRDELHREALAAAARDARANAAALAAALDGRIGPVRSVQAGGFPRPPQPMMRSDVAPMALETAAETYQTGDIKIDARVSAVFDLQID